MLRNVVERVADTIQNKEQHQRRKNPHHGKDNNKEEDKQYIIPKEVIRAASDLYRQLETRIPVGALSTIPDSAERRAAVLLEHCYRRNHPQKQYDHPVSSGNNSNANNNNTNNRAPPALPWNVLGEAIAVTKIPSLPQLQHVLLNFLQPATMRNRSQPPPHDAVFRNHHDPPPSDDGEPNKTVQYTTATAANANSQTNNKQKRQSLRSRLPTIDYTLSLSQNAAHSNNNVTFPYAPTILPELVIRLTGFWSDPHGILLRTTQLLEDIHSYYDKNYITTTTTNTTGGSGGTRHNKRTTVSANNATERRGHFYDLQRYAAAYEAAALYHVAATRSTNHTHISTSTENSNSNNNSNRGVDEMGGSDVASLPARTRKSTQGKKRAPTTINDEALNPHDDEASSSSVHHHREHSSLSNRSLNIQQQQQQDMIFRPLQLDDLMEACSKFTYLEVKQVLPRVQELARKIAERDRQLLRLQQQQQQDHRRSSGNKESTTDEECNKSLSNKKKKKNNSEGQLLTAKLPLKRKASLLSRVETLKKTASHTGEERSSYKNGSDHEQQEQQLVDELLLVESSMKQQPVMDYKNDCDNDDKKEQSFLQWRSLLLQRARDQARRRHCCNSITTTITEEEGNSRRIGGDPGRDTTTTNNGSQKDTIPTLLVLSNSEAMAMAADAVFRKHGILF